MNNDQAYMKEAIDHLNAENAFSFFFNALNGQGLERAMLETTLKETGKGELRVTADSLSYEKFVPDYAMNISKLLKFEVFFEKDIATRVILLSNYELVSLKEILAVYPGTCTFVEDYRAEATLFSIVAAEMKVKQVKAWLNKVLDLADMNAARLYGEENIRFNKIELIG